MKRAYVMERDNIRFMSEFVPDNRGSVSKVIRGLQLSPDDISALPKTLDINVTKLPGKLPPAIIVQSNVGPWIVSDAVRAHLEHLEPNTHHFAPINVTSFDGSAKPSQVHAYPNYSILVSTPAIDCVVSEKTGIRRADGSLASVGEIVSEIGVCTLGAAAVGGSHLWRGVGESQFAFFVSDELHDWFIASDVTGVRSGLGCELE
jgi:hypothetical protein